MFGSTNSAMEFEFVEAGVDITADITKKPWQMYAPMFLETTVAIENE